jgi:hypothetical protein
VLRIVSFPVEATEQSVKEQGWPYQIRAPLDAVLSVREAAQGYRGEQHLILLRRAWQPGDQDKAADPDKVAQRGKSVDIQVPPPVRFESTAECPPEPPPLSWRRRTKQKQCIEAAWDASGPQIAAQVRTFLKGD